jgi:predicted transcriptional regulator
MTAKKTENMAEISRKLDHVVALLRVIARKELEAVKKSVLSTIKKERIYELCDGKMETAKIAKKVGVSGEYVRLTLKEFEDAGLVLIKRIRGKRYPERML